MAKVSRKSVVSLGVLWLYTLLLVWCKTALVTLWLTHGGLVTIGGLAIVPIAILLSLYYRRPKKSNAPLSRIRTLSDQQQHLLRKNMPTGQLALFNDILLVSLGLLYELLHDMPAEQGEGSLFDEKYTQLLALFRALYQQSRFISGTATARATNNAIVAFSFYRILFQGVIEKGKAMGRFAGDSDEWILLKRIPPKLSVYLGSQAWRLYELKTLLYGDLTTLQLNGDILDSLQSLLPKAIPSHLEISTDDNVEEESTLAPVKQCVQVVPEAEKSTAMTVASDNSATETETEKSATAAHWMQRFDSCLQRELKRHGVNNNGLFFVDPQQGDVKHVFISDAGFANFAKKYAMPLSRIQANLKTNGRATPTVFETKQSNGGVITLTQVSVDYAIEVLHPLAHPILAVIQPEPSTQ